MMCSLASQKNNMTVYLMSVFGGAAGTNGGIGSEAEREWFQKAWKATGKKLHMGGCCIHFKTLEDAALDVIGEAIRRMPAKTYVDNYIKALASTGRGPDGKKLKGETTAKKKAATKVAQKTAAKKKSKTTKRPAKR
jgi:hypothetical protein